MSSTIRHEEARYLVRQLFRGFHGGSLKVDLRSMLFQLTFNIMVGMVVGKRCFVEVATDVEMGLQLLKILKEMSMPSILTSSCDFFPILRLVGFQGVEKNMVSLKRKRDAFLQDLIDSECQRRQTESSTTTTEAEKKKTIIGALLSIQEAEPEHYSDDIIKGVILKMFTTGTDLTVHTMEWAMSALLNHPEDLTKARVEIDDNVEQGHLLSDSDLAKHPYLRCIINETLRVYSPVPLLVEPMKFKPERFQGMDVEREGFKFMPFGMGRRGCPGAGLATRAVALVLGTLIQCFEWERFGEEKVDMTEDGNGLSMAMAKPLEAMYRPRPTMVELLSQL
ncbi:hypothetical protein HHK36_008337 [Tetracentron sinense]|uniref:Cytochrome P450 n=1 Tax=Tetracentron sinense TaxID=13715 RepID=A0A834ZPZ8_TETSI|nr:hypothetical protein HHK36_008337 [Tetracentron sinense]